MYTFGVPPDQRAGARPISFVLDNLGTFGSQITLKLRPEDLTRTEPSRINPNQTLGRGVIGWADNFGPGLPGISIAGNTGWRATGNFAEDGITAFLALHQLVHLGYHEAVQSAIDSGRDPAGVKLIFADLLDEFCWSVVPISFVLRRSKSRPLLMQYNIQLQTLSTSPDDPLSLFPELGNITTGIAALDALLDTLDEMATTVQAWVSQALAYKDKVLAPIAGTIKKFVAVTGRVYRAVSSIVNSVKGGISGAVNSLIGIAGDLSRVGTNIFRIIASVSSLPGHVRSEIMKVAGAYNEAFCVFMNSLRARKVYDDFSSLYGASNCSSTTGGRMPSRYAGSNINTFAETLPDPVTINLSGPALAGISALKRIDPVFASVEPAEMQRHLNNINNGIEVF